MQTITTTPPQRAPTSPRTPRSPTIARVNRNAEWVSTPGGWAFIGSLLLLTWLAASVAVGPGAAWTIVHLAHGGASFYLLHWMKGSPVQADQGKYDGETFWEQVRLVWVGELGWRGGRNTQLVSTLTPPSSTPLTPQLDDGVHHTPTRKFLTVLPALTFAAATHGTDFASQPLGLNLAVLIALMVAKLPSMHRVRVFGINRW